MALPGHKRHLVLDSTIFDLQLDGGISRYWYELVANLANRHDDWNLTLLADPHTSNKFGRKLIEETREKSNVTMHEYVPRQIGRLFGPRLSDEHKESLWHSSYYRLPTGTNNSAVCTVHDFIYERYFSGLQARLHAWKKRRAILAAAEIICVSQATKRNLFELFPLIAEDKCRVIYHGPSRAFHPVAKESRLAHRQASVPNVLFVGSRASYKNFKLTILAVAEVPDHELYIVGGGALSKTELRLLTELLPNRHRIYEAPSDEVLCGLYQNATALAYPSQCEGFGFPPLEAMACGCPVIALDASSIPEVVGDAGILLQNEHPSSIADAIRAVSVHGRRQEIIDKGIKRAALFSWDRAVDQTVEVYEKAINARR